VTVRAILADVCEHGLDMAFDASHLFVHAT
jgi:hypothetical protein